jgi:hypothetical protein
VPIACFSASGLISPNSRMTLWAVSSLKRNTGDVIELELLEDLGGR